MIQDGEVYFPKEQTGYLSVFCLGDRAEGVCETGLKYSLSDAELTKEFPIGVSNEFTGKRAFSRKILDLLRKNVQNGDD